MFNRSAEEVANINKYFQDRMAENKKIWASRGKDARVAATAKRAAESSSWRQLRGVPLAMHEISHIGNRPFMVGFATVAIGTLYIQTKFTDEMKADSLYWSTFHGKK